MTDDKEEREERILRLTEEEFLVYRDGAWDEYGSKILLKIMSRNWFDLELAPKHTDEEYDHIKECYDHVYDDWKVSRNAFEARIIELEADYAKLINHTDPDYVIGLQLRIKELGG